MLASVICGMKFESSLLNLFTPNLLVLDLLRLFTTQFPLLPLFNSSLSMTWSCSIITSSEVLHYKEGIVCLWPGPSTRWRSYMMKGSEMSLYLLAEPEIKHFRSGSTSNNRIHLILPSINKAHLIFAHLPKTA